MLLQALQDIPVRHFREMGQNTIHSRQPSRGSQTGGSGDERPGLAFFEWDITFRHFHYG
jgi:hypothetical protein